MFTRSSHKNKSSNPPSGPGAAAGRIPASAGGAGGERSSAAADAARGKLAYEARRAAKAGVSLEKWMADKQKRTQLEQEAEQRARRKQQPAKPPGLLRRLLDRAHKPL